MVSREKWDKKDIDRTLFLVCLVLLSSFLVLNVQLTLIVGVFTDEDDLEVRCAFTALRMKHQCETSTIIYKLVRRCLPDIQNYNEYCSQPSESIQPYFMSIIKSQVTTD